MNPGIFAANMPSWYFLSICVYLRLAASIRVYPRLSASIYAYLCLAASVCVYAGALFRER